MLRARSMSDPVIRKATGPDTVVESQPAMKWFCRCSVWGVATNSTSHMCFHLFDQNMLIAIF